jgi:hypothetical protein
VWGTNGLPWKDSLQQIDDLGLKPEVKQKLLHDNVSELFKIEKLSGVNIREHNESKLSVH